MKVLFVTFAFPPLGGSGIQRPLKFVKYLPEFGVSPILITTDVEGLQAHRGEPIKAELLHEIPQELVVERIPCPPSSTPKLGSFQSTLQNLFRLRENASKQWKPHLEQALPKIIEMYQPEAIYVTVPPFGMGPLWCDLAQKYKLPLVVDIRDPWSQSGTTLHQSWIHYFLTLRVERRMLEVANRVICVTNQVGEDLKNVHPDVPANKFVTIISGYDTQVNDWSLQKRALRDDEKFTIGYVGALYYSPKGRQDMMLPWWRKKVHRMPQYASRRGDLLYQSPYFFFRAVALLLKTRPELEQKIRIRFAGNKPNWLDDQINRFDLNDIVEHVGYLDFQSCQKFQSDCDCLLLTSTKFLKGEEYCISGKTFEYFVARKPILGFVAPGTQKDFLAKSGMAVLCDPDDTDEGAAKIASLIDGEVDLKPNVQFLNSLNSCEQTKILSEVFCELRNEKSLRSSDS